MKTWAKSKKVIRCSNCERPAVYEFTDIGRSLAFSCEQDKCFNKIKKLINNKRKEKANG